jgi:branched-chain amino acid transport system ATP-binding protein
MTAGAALEARGLVAGFGAATVLHGVDLSVSSGEVVGILGLNGAGKSVTLKVLAGLVPARAGSVKVDGTDLTRLSPEARVGHGLGHVMQGRHVFGEMTVEQNLRLGAYLLRRRQPDEYANVLAEVFERFPRLEERREQRAGTLSGGEQAMLAVGRALMGRPKLVLIDEPTAGLSPLAAEGLLETMRQTRGTGVTMLLVEQNTRFALELSDRILIMRSGQVVHESASADIQPDELASQLGIGRILGHIPGASASKSTAKRAAVKRSTKKTSAKKAVSKKAVSKKSATKKAPAKKAPARKAAR